jgi:formamidopyrimidine-DNA glycosylase
LPELPEVQTIVDGLIGADIVGRRIRQASVYWPNTIAITSPQTFSRKIRKKRIVDIQRRGKFILFRLHDGLFIAVHLRMTGRFEIGLPNTIPSRHVHIVIDINDGRRIMFHDTRKFGRFYITKKINDIIGSIGPEPLGSGFTAKRLAAMLSGRKRQIKPLLLDQNFLAGLGNIYVDESLWHARIHPERSSDSLQWSETKSLHRAIRHVLRLGLRNAGTSLGKGLGNYSRLDKAGGRNGEYLKVFRRTGKACFKCGHPIERLVVAQRGTHVCLNCQTIPYR